MKTILNIHLFIVKSSSIFIEQYLYNVTIFSVTPEENVKI